ncbi:MAG: transcription elongation factor GreA [Desulfurivibrionaceae bacterium]|nr:transcription elongation factor GreA [Desulfurivibrionaceae bacterium]
MVERIPMSKTGYTRLKEELERLQSKDRYEVIKSIEIALGHGDLKENAEYHAAKERQGHIEGRIQELKDKLGRSEVIDCTKVSVERVVFGTKVTVVDLDTDEEVTYWLVGSDEADVKKGSISVMSPWGRALIGKEEGDEVVVKIPKGILNLEIISIECGDIP